ncbi:hypothetical protein F0562_022109 [Nyssa sinensis]|uniref:Uncharacterized protein n=1 Tax=Nyssa sinensis TaxID=561372 RepID=A0A5J5BQP0_9ASTE|nr:hypothetical protein F0562_022109 [Nyssa sinensis]
MFNSSGDAALSSESGAVESVFVDDGDTLAMDGLWAGPFSKLYLANLVNIGAIKAAVEGAEKLTGAELEFAKDRIFACPNLSNL